MNHMAQVADMLDLKLDEPFHVKKTNLIFKLTIRGLECFYGENWTTEENYETGFGSLAGLLSGKFEVDKTGKYIESSKDELIKEYKRLTDVIFDAKVTYEERKRVINSTSRNIDRLRKMLYS